MKAFSKSGKVSHYLSRHVCVKCLEWTAELSSPSQDARFVDVEDAIPLILEKTSGRSLKK